MIDLHNTVVREVRYWVNKTKQKNQWPTKINVLIEIPCNYIRILVNVTPGHSAVMNRIDVLKSRGGRVGSTGT